MPSLLKEELALAPFVAASREELGRVAARDIATALRNILALKRSVRMIFAAAPSQSTMLEALAEEPGIDWPLVTAFHMDEYLGLPTEAPQRFSEFLRRSIFSRVPFGAVHLLDPGSDPQATVVKYASLLNEAPIDLLLCGIGSNGHLAFNDPPALFDDPADVKIVQLDAACRQQQVDDLCFENFDDVPTEAITLSIPRLLRSDHVFCCVPGALKAEAVRGTLEGPITGLCPASILRLHPSCKLYLDQHSASRLTQ
jgi:glucosamine-6-phosphate deaminase